jgi:hypothetical protein
MGAYSLTSSLLPPVRAEGEIVRLLAQKRKGLAARNKARGAKF